MSNHITREDVDKVAALARLDLTDAEEKRTVSELESILTYIDRLSAVDTTKVTAYEGASVSLSLLREDSIHPFSERDALLSKDRFKNDLLVTKGVFSSAKGGSASGGKDPKEIKDAS